MPTGSYSPRRLCGHILFWELARRPCAGENPLEFVGSPVKFQCKNGFQVDLLKSTLPSLADHPHAASQPWEMERRAPGAMVEKQGPGRPLSVTLYAMIELPPET